MRGTAYLSFFRGYPTALSNLVGGFQSASQLPVIDGANVFVGDFALTADDGGFWQAIQPTAPPGAQPAWNFILTMRGAPGPQGLPGIGYPGPAGQQGPPGIRGGTGPMGPAGTSSFSYTSNQFAIPAFNAQPVTVPVTDSTWMRPGQLVYIPNAGTFNVVGSPPNPYAVALANSGDPNNYPPGTIINAGQSISPAAMRGPPGPAGQTGPSGPPGPQGVSGTSAYTTLASSFVVPTSTGTAFVQSAAVFAVGMIVYIAGGDYFSVTAVDPVANSLTLVNQQFPGGAPVGTTLPAGSTVSGTGPQGPMGNPGPAGATGPQGATGLFQTGTIFMYGSTSPPLGALNCDGASYPQSQFPNLFNVITTKFGPGTDPSGNTTFQVPDLRGRFPIGIDAAGVNGIAYALAATGGQAQHTLTTAEIPAHLHLITDVTHTHTDITHSHTATATSTDSGHIHGASQIIRWDQYTGVSVLGGGYQLLSTLNTGANQYWNGNTLSAAANISTSVGIGLSSVTINPSLTGITTTQNSTGGGGSHENRPPYLGINFCIQT